MVLKYLQLQYIVLEKNLNCIQVVYDYITERFFRTPGPRIYCFDLFFVLFNKIKNKNLSFFVVVMLKSLWILLLRFNR